MLELNNEFLVSQPILLENINIVDQAMKPRCDITSDFVYFMFESLIIMIVVISLKLKFYRFYLEKLITLIIFFKFTMNSLLHFWLTSIKCHHIVSLNFILPKYYIIKIQKTAQAILQNISIMTYMTKTHYGDIYIYIQHLY